MTIFDYFDRVEIIHLPERHDRLKGLASELCRLGFDIARANVPSAPRPHNPRGFPSRGVYGNFLSHLDILERAYADKLESVLVLEDDAIFSRSLSWKMQQEIISYLASNEWDELFIGHSIRSGLPNSKSRLVRFSGRFIWSHCYAISRRIMPRVITYLQDTVHREAGHPDGGKMYIDGAHSEFRRKNPDVICLLSSPCLSVQRGSPSSLGAMKWYDESPVLRTIVSSARNARDELWRRGMITIGTSQWTEIESAHPWPSTKA